MLRQSFKSLVIFTKVVEKKSMVAAAQSLKMTPPAVTQQIHRLEEQIGLSLLNRNTRGLTLTDAGRAFYEKCRILIEAAEEANDTLDLYRGSAYGEVKIAAPSGFSAELLARPLQLLMESNNDLKINLMLQDGQIDLVSNSIDIGIQMGHVGDDDLAVHPLASWHMKLCVAPLYLDQKRLTLPEHPSELSQWDRLIHQKCSKYLSRLSNFKTGEEYVLPSARVEVNCLNSVSLLTLQGLGYAILPGPDADKYIQQGKLVQLLPNWSLPVSKCYAITPKGELAPKVQEALRILKICFNNID